jgi:hypothetical protein
MTRARLVISPTMLRLARPAIVAWICRMLRSVDRGERHDLADDMLWGRWSSEVFATRFRGPHSGGDTGPLISALSFTCASAKPAAMSACSSPWFSCPE